MAGLLKPRHQVLGLDVAGQVVVAGANFKQCQPGEDVFALSLNLGAFAEYLRVPESRVPAVERPAGMSFEEAASVPFSALTAQTCLRDFGAGSGGAEGSDQRRFWCRGSLCCAARQVLQ